MGWLGCNPNQQNLNVQVTLPSDLKLLPFVHENRNPAKERQWQLPSLNATVTIPAGYYFLEINNVSLSDMELTINGAMEVIKPGQKFSTEDRLDWQHLKQELGPAITIKNNTGDPIPIHICYPNDSSVNPYTI